jgi:hypothetical protein
MSKTCKDFRFVIAATDKLVKLGRLATLRAFNEDGRVVVVCDDDDDDSQHNAKIPRSSI